ncbi:MAG TPA: spermidine/putrescine ABC transporter substrate-binding protein [Acidobacteriota bacterium]|nr:spermidine/putrescine ABC transporter substrate-binding protein [Acidobacteriota bacterium]
MAFHPRDPTWRRSSVNRRDLLRMAAGASLGATFAGACASGERPPDGDRRVLIGTPDSPVEHPILDDNPPIDSGLDIEPGPLRIFNWADYLHVPVLNAFAEQYGVEWEYTTFYNNEEAIRKLRTNAGNFDVFFTPMEQVPKCVAGQLLQPLNHDYLPNLANVWPSLISPFYDQGARYTAPYSVYQTGITWREDMISPNLEAMTNPWHVFWDPKYREIAGLYDDFRETIGVGLYATGTNEINTADPTLLEKARRKLLELIDLINVRFTIDGAYAKIAERAFALHHAWSGDVVQAQVYFPPDEDPSAMRYFWPPRSERSSAGGMVSVESFVIPKNAEHPVLAHHFMNFMLETTHALNNFGWTGNPPPLATLDPETFVSEGHIPPNLATTITTEDDFSIGQLPLQLAPEVEIEWMKIWASVQSGG